MCQLEKVDLSNFQRIISYNKGLSDGKILQIDNIYKTLMYNNNYSLSSYRFNQNN